MVVYTMKHKTTPKSIQWKIKRKSRLIMATGKQLYRLNSKLNGIVHHIYKIENARQLLVNNVHFSCCFNFYSFWPFFRAFFIFFFLPFSRSEYFDDITIKDIGIAQPVKYKLHLAPSTLIYLVFTITQILHETHCYGMVKR